MYKLGKRNLPVLQGEEEMEVKKYEKCCKYIALFCRVRRRRRWRSTKSAASILLCSARWGREGGEEVREVLQVYCSVLQGEEERAVKKYEKCCKYIALFCRVRKRRRLRSTKKVLQYIALFCRVRRRRRWRSTRSAASILLCSAGWGGEGCEEVREVLQVYCSVLQGEEEKAVKKYEKCCKYIALFCRVRRRRRWRSTRSAASILLCWGTAWGAQTTRRRKGTAGLQPQRLFRKPLHFCSGFSWLSL
jgi:hypothetical protein